MQASAFVPDPTSLPYICNCRSYQVGAVAELDQSFLTRQAILPSPEVIQQRYGKSAQALTLRWHCFSCSAEWFSVMIHHFRTLDINHSGPFREFVMSHTTGPAQRGGMPVQKQSQEQPSERVDVEDADPFETGFEKAGILATELDSELTVQQAFGHDLSFFQGELAIPNDPSQGSQLSSVYGGSSPGLTFPDLGSRFRDASLANLQSAVDFRPKRRRNSDWVMEDDDNPPQSSNRGTKFNLREYNWCRKYGACPSHKRQKKKCTCYQHNGGNWLRTGSTRAG